MPSPTRLPRGCSSSRGSSDIPHSLSLGGERARQVNRLYMLTVKWESFTNKKRSLITRLKDLETQIKGIEETIHGIQKKYQGLLPGPIKKGIRPLKKNREENGRNTKTMNLKY